MQRSSRAPVLSATRRRDSCWITGPPSLCGLDDLLQTPALHPRQRPRLDDPHDVPHLRLVPLVVRVELRAPANDLLVPRVHLHDIDADDDRLVRGGGDDRALTLLTSPAHVLRLRQPDDRPPLLRLLAGRAPPLWGEG